MHRAIVLQEVKTVWAAKFSN